MEHDPVKEAERNEKIAQWGARYGLIFEDGRADFFGLIGPCVIDLTAAEEGLWLFTTLTQAFQQGFKAGEEHLAEKLRATLGIRP